MEIQEVLGLDVGSVRVGVARVNMIAKIPEALSYFLTKNDITSLRELNHLYQPNAIVVGLPRNMQNEDTKQTEFVRQWMKSVLPIFKDLPFFWQDEAATSIEASELLGPKADKKDIDSLAACIILKDFIATPIKDRVAINK